MKSAELHTDLALVQYQEVMVCIASIWGWPAQWLWLSSSPVEFFEALWVDGHKFILPDSRDGLVLPRAQGDKAPMCALCGAIAQNSIVRDTEGVWLLQSCPHPPS